MVDNFSKVKRSLSFVGVFAPWKFGYSRSDLDGNKPDKGNA